MIKATRGSAAPIFGLALLLWAGVSHAAETGPADGPYDAATRQALHAVIMRQLEAIGRDDAKTAESLAAPKLRERYPDPADFLAMVKTGYGALIRPRGTHFDETSDSPHGPLQRMTIVASDGTVWTAVYAFQREGDAWRISACGLERQKGEDI